MDDRTNSFGYWLRRRRKALDLTQEALAQKVSCSQAAIKKIEADERRPSIGLAQRLADQLGVPAAERDAFLHAARQLGVSAWIHTQGRQLAEVAGNPVRESVQPAAQPKSPFVGRDNEYGQCLGLIAGLTTGSGRVVLVQGEAGIGKSRLIREVLAGSQQQVVTTLTTTCYEIERSIAYQPVIDLATQACLATPESRLRMIAPILLAEVAALVPAMSSRLPDLPPLSADFPEARQARMFHALVELFDAVAKNRELIVVIDNIQWADDASLRFVHFLARQIASRPVFLACAYRDEELDNNDHLAGLVESLRREPYTRHMALARLGPGDTESLLQRMNEPRLGVPGLAVRLHGESEGNPFFLWSILHSLSETEGAIGDSLSLPLPDAVRDSVRVRLARVPATDRPLLDLAAVLGRRFDFETLLALTRAPEESFLHSLDALVRRRLLREEQEGGFYDFSHDKVREVVYRDIGVARRVLLHRVVAELLEQHPAGQTHERNAHLAEHYERGKVWPKAIHYLGQAADHSQKLFAMGESLQWLDRAVALLQAHPDAATQAQQMALYEQRGVARAQAGQTEGAVADFKRVVQAARALDQHEHARDVLIQLGMAYRRADAYEPAVACLDEALTASRATGDERHVADTLYHLGTVAWSNGRNDLAISHHQQAVEICTRLGLVDLVAVQAFHGRGEAHLANAEPAAAIAAFSRSLLLARAIEDKSYEAENLMMIGWSCAGHVGLADYTRALSHFDAALAIARAADLQWHLGPSLIGRAYVLLSLGRYRNAQADLDEALPRLEILGLVRYQMMAHDALGCLMLELDRPKTASQHFETGLSLARDAGIKYWLPRLQANLAIAQLRSGVPFDRGFLQQAQRDAQQKNEAWLTLRCMEALAESALVSGDGQQCIEHVDQLMALARAGDMREQMGRACRLRGLARLATGDDESAVSDLTQAVKIAQQIGHLRLERDCHLALDRVGAAFGKGNGDGDGDEVRRARVSTLSAQLAGLDDGNARIAG